MTFYSSQNVRPVGFGGHGVVSHSGGLDVDKFGNPLPDQVYYDLTYTNFDSNQSGPIQFYYNDVRSEPYLYNPQDYYLTVIRYTVDAGTLPVWIPSIQYQTSLPQDVNLTNYSVTLEYTYAGVTYASQCFIEWIPQDKSVPAPSSLSSTGFALNSDGYYNCKSYAYVCQLVQNAINNAFNGTPYPSGQSLLAQLATAGAITTAQYAPRFDWDSASNCVILTASYEFVQNQASPISIYLNPSLHNLYNTFNVTEYGYNTTLGRHAKLMLFEQGGLNSITISVPNTTPAATYKAYQLAQEAPTVETLQPIKAMVFTSYTLPLQKSNISTPKIYLNGQPTAITSSNNAVDSVITDIVASDGLYRPTIVYSPSSQYRYHQLYGNQSLSQIDITISTRDAFGQLTPFLLGSGGTVTMKLLFVKKSSLVYNPTYGPIDNTQADPSLAQNKRAKILPSY